MSADVTLTLLLGAHYLLGPQQQTHCSSMRRPNDVTVNIACLQGTQQQTRRTMLQWSTDGTDRQMDGHCTITQTQPQTMRAMTMMNVADKFLYQSVGKILLSKIMPAFLNCFLQYVKIPPNHCL